MIKQEIDTSLHVRIEGIEKAISMVDLFEYWLNVFGIPNRYFIRVMAQFTTEDDLRREKLIEMASSRSEFH
jgi:hypothetical protein